MAEANGLTTQLEGLRIKAAEATMGAGLSQIGGAAINYALLSGQAKFQENSADSIELQAQEQANMLRENFNYAIGTEITSAARRGIKVGEGSAAKSLEDSAKNVGSDISKLKSNAANKARMVRTQAKLNKRSAMTGLVSGMIMGGVSAYGGYTNLNK